MVRGDLSDHWAAVGDGADVKVTKFKAPQLHVESVNASDPQRMRGVKPADEIGRPFWHLRSKQAGPSRA
jgi:hypothetical protein